MAENTTKVEGTPESQHSNNAVLAVRAAFLIVMLWLMLLMVSIAARHTAGEDRYVLQFILVAPFTGVVMKVSRIVWRHYR